MDINGLYAGEKTRSLKSFIQVFRSWQCEVMKNTQLVSAGMKYDRVEYPHEAIARVFNFDITQNTQNQIIKSVDHVDGAFSYYKNFGNDERGAFVDVGGFPLDIKHFMANVELANNFGEAIANQGSINEEYWQSYNPTGTEDAKSSGFSPEDLVSNSLGILFSRFDQNGDFADNLNGFLQEAAILFSQNELKNGKYITDNDVTALRETISKYQGTSDFRDLNKSSKLYSKESLDSNREKRVNEMSGAFKKFLEYFHPKK